MSAERGRGPAERECKEERGSAKRVAVRGIIDDPVDTDRALT